MSDVIKGTLFSYKIDKEYGINKDGFIAEGTESIVFKGVKTGEDLTYSCVLKFKPKSRLQDFKAREYKLLESMQTCRSIVRVLDIIEDLDDFVMTYDTQRQQKITLSRDNVFCVVEEYIDGDSLQNFCIKYWFEYNERERRWCRNLRPYTYREIVKFQNQILQFMINLCEIMKFVSGKMQILHCDIKPENIMVTKHGKELVLIDFGRSYAFSKENDFYQHRNNQETATFTADYHINETENNIYAYGTIGYAAPECYAKSIDGKSLFIEQGSEEYGRISVETDIFGFGVTFWECFSMYEICMEILDNAAVTNSESFFNDVIFDMYGISFRRSNVNIWNNDDIIFQEYCKNYANGNESAYQKSIEKVMSICMKKNDLILRGYCDRDFRDIDIAYHEAIETVLKKCMHTRTQGFHDKKSHEYKNYYHDFQNLQNDIEKARDTIPSLDRKSDPLVKQMILGSGLCSAIMLFFLFMFVLLKIFANPLALDKWNRLKSQYTENQNLELKNIAEEMMEVPFQSDKDKNFEEIMAFMYGGSPNDDFINQEESQILTDIIIANIDNMPKCGYYINLIMQNAKSDNLDDISKNIYRINLPEDTEQEGYEIAKAIVQVNEADDKEAKKLLYAYEIFTKYNGISEYEKVVSRLATKLMTGKKIDTIATGLGMERETIREILSSAV